MKKFIYVFILSILITVLVLSCKNPMVGLGPAADISSPNGGIDVYVNGDYVRGQITLSGTSTDDVKIESVKAVLNNEVFEAELTQGEITLWSIPLDTTKYADDEYTIVLTITDSSGRETEKRLLLYFDNTAPTVMVTSSEGISTGAATKSPVIRGEAYDYLFSRIDHMEAEVVSGDAEIDDFQGTNGWSLTLKTTGTGIYAVRIKAYDSAGNSNSWLYHSSELPLSTKIENVAAADKTGSLGSYDLVTLRKTAQEVVVDMGSDEPRVVVSNPQEGKTAEANVLGGTSSAVGYIEDNNDVDSSSVELSLDGGSTWQPLSGTQLNGGGGFIRWNYDLSMLDNGVYSLQVRAKDINKAAGDDILTGYSSVVPFTMDKTAPSVAVSSPEPGSYLDSGSFTISGTAQDIGGSVQSIRISTDDGINYQNADSFSPGENITWSHGVTGVAPGAVAIKVEAVDNSGKISYFNQQIYVDTAFPTVNFLSPAAGLFINGTTTLQGVSSDNWSLKQVKLQIGGLAWAPEAAEALPPAEFYSWQRNIVSSNFENTGMAVEVNGSGLPESGTGIWELKIWAEAVDKADNTTLKEHKIYIDNSLDRPGINIASPSAGAVLAGSVMLSGSAWDDKNEAGENLDHIELRIWKGADGAGGVTTFSDLFDLHTLLSLEDVYGDDSWYKVSGTSTWQTELNADGEFYPNGIDHNGTVKIDVRAVDQKGGLADLAGNIESIEVTFDDTVPFFSGLSHVSGDYEKGTFSLIGTVSDDDSVKRLRISYNGGVSWITIGTDLGVSSIFSHSIDSNSIVGTSGILYLRLEALDTANYKTLVAINLNIDNLNPTGTYTAGITDLSGTALVQGIASDTGTVSGTDRIEVSFTLDGNPVNALSSKGLRTPIVIDSRTEVGNDGSSNGDDDGFNESMSISGNTWTWWAEFDTTSLEDGVLEVIYTVYDNAGNKYTETVTGGNIKNHAPAITSIDAGWDYDHDGTVETEELKSYTSDTTESNTAYGMLQYNFNRTYDGQNGALTYGLRMRPSGGEWTALETISQSGSLNTVSHPGFVSGDGDYEIEFSVSDEKGYSSLKTIGFTIGNNDNEDPVMVFYELTTDDAMAVKTGDIGHIEIDGNIYLSGKIPFSGRAEDNQKIQSISVKIGDGDFTEIILWDSEDKCLKYVDSDDRVMTDGTEFINDSGLLKHRADWEYEWDSSTLPTGLGTDVIFRVTDAAGRAKEIKRTYDVVPYITKVDTALSSSLSSNLARSAEGRYTVLRETNPQNTNEITVYGFNIIPSAGGTSSVHLSKYEDAWDGSGFAGTEFVPTNESDTNGQKILAKITADGSGYLSVVVDEVASRNNINSNSNLYNIEASEVHNKLSDDRYISVWDIFRLWEGTDAEHAEYPAMAMLGDTPHFTFVNNSKGYGQAFYYDGTTNKQFIENWDLFTYTAIDLNDTGKHAALVDLNIVNGNFGDYNAGNYGGIFVNFFYDVPYYNWQNYTFRDNGVWLENLVDESGGTTAVLNRYQYPDILVNGPDSSTKVFYSVYDTLSKRLLFRHFKVGTSDSVNTGSGGRINNEGTALYTNVKQQNYSGAWPSYTNNKNSTDALRFTGEGAALSGTTPPGAQSLSTTANKFSAVGATSDGSTAVIAYYDTSGSGKLVFRYNANPDDENTWSELITIEEFVNAEYIDLKVDAGDHIHIAYYDSFHGDVKYAYIPSCSSNENTVKLYTVDSYLIVGSKLTLDVSKPGPDFISGDEFIGDVYLAYKGLGNTAKAAWLKGPAGDGAEYDKFTGTWEVQTVPNIIADSDSNRFNIGVDTAGLPVVGYTDDGLEYVRLLPELSN